MKKLLGILLTALFMAAMILLGAAAGLTIYAVMNGEAPWQQADSDVSDGAESGDSAGSEDSADSQEGASGETEEPVAGAVQEGDLGSYHVKIKSAASVEDYEGRRAVVVTYAWTNNSGSTASAYTAIHVKASQNDVPLDSTVVIAPGKFDAAGYMREIQPGRSADVQSAFRLKSDTAAVKIEVSELGGSSGDTVVMEFALSELG